MRNDRKGAPAQNLVGQGTHQSALAFQATDRRSQADSLAPALAVDMRAARLFANRLQRGNRPCLHSQYFRNVTACFTCFIRLRSGIANSRQNKLSLSAAANICAITIRLWQPHGGSAFTRRWQGRKRRRQVPPCTREPERRADAIRRRALLAFLHGLTATPEPMNFALIRYDAGMKAVDCIALSTCRHSNNG
jgi:hypothetical protein